MSERSQVQRYALPDEYVDRLFDRLEAAYGDRWMRMWGNTNLANVKALWAEKLGGFHDNLAAIKYALDSLDEHPFPPTLPEFLALCRKAPRKELKRLPPPPPNKEKADAFLAKAMSVLSKKSINNEAA